MLGGHVFHIDPWCRSQALHIALTDLTRSRAGKAEVIRSLSDAQGFFYTRAHLRVMDICTCQLLVEGALWWGDGRRGNISSQLVGPLSTVLDISPAADISRMKDWPLELGLTRAHHRITVLARCKTKGVLDMLHSASHMSHIQNRVDADS